MNRTAKIHRLLPLLAFGALIVAGCEESPAPVTGPRIEASRLKHEDFRQEDRFGLPAIATVFIPTALKDAYNEAAPAGDRRCIPPGSDRGTPCLVRSAAMKRQTESATRVR